MEDNSAIKSDSAICSLCQCYISNEENLIGVCRLCQEELDRNDKPSYDSVGICSLCGCETNDTGYVKFLIGILPYTLCPICCNGLADAFECFDSCRRCGCENPHSYDELGA